MLETQPVCMPCVVEMSGNGVYIYIRVGMKLSVLSIFVWHIANADRTMAYKNPEL